MQYRYVKRRRKRRQQIKKAIIKLRNNAILGKSVETPINKCWCKNYEH